MSIDTGADSSFDVILNEVGQFGVYQVVTYLLICIPNILSATYAVNYMFSANTLDYRWVNKISTNEEIHSDSKSIFGSIDSKFIQTAAIEYLNI